MEAGSRVEVHFYSAKEAGVSVLAEVDSYFREFEEILLFCCFATEQLVQLGKTMRMAGVFLALVLINIRDSLALLGTYETPFEPLITTLSGPPAPKRFVGKVTRGANGFGFTLTAYGLALFSRRRTYYESESVLVLLRYLAQKSLSDSEYLAALSWASAEIGVRYLQGGLAKPDHLDVARRTAILAAGKISTKQCVAVRR